LPRRITRDVPPTSLRNLLKRPERAYLAFNDAACADGARVRFLFRDERYCVEVGPEVVARGVGAGAAVTLLLDRGWYWYDLQCIRVRGTLRAAGDDFSVTPTAATWFEVVPRVLVAWDYGMLRETEGDDAD
jgi:hypothetical protein